jgi:hypothetical protein
MTNLSNHLKSEHQRMSKILGYALTAGSDHGWDAFSLVAAVRLKFSERASLAFATLTSLDAETACDVVNAALIYAGYPLPTFLNPVSEARQWASLATRPERKAYALAAYEALSIEDQIAFCQRISDVKMAA